ncbi:MAG: hypothetical protein ABUS57_08045 [Pseudomonadota bacterium]
MSMNTGTIVAAVRLRKERALVGHLRELGALSADHAALLGAPRGMANAVLRGLIRNGVVVKASEDAYWLNESAYAEMRARRRKRIAIVLSCVVVVLCIVAGVTYALTR